MDEAHDIVQLKVRLLGISPMIWRRVQVPVDMTLRELHGVCQVAMGWEGIHFYAFDIRAVQYGAFELLIGDPRTPLRRFGFRKNDKFDYIYDLNDRWEHEVRVEGFGIAATNKFYPVCTGGSGACPPEECGGPVGYRMRRDEATGYTALRDVEVMAEWLEGLIARGRADLAGLTVRDVLTDDVEIAMERVVAREPYNNGKFSRKLVNQAFRQGQHRELMHQQW